MTRGPSLPDEWVARGLALRPETGEDGLFLLDLFAATRGPEFAALGWPEPALRSFLTSQAQLQARHYETAYPGAFRGIVTGQGVAVGRLYLHSRPGDIRVVDISLLPQWRDQGLGSALLGAVQAMAKAADAGISLSVSIGNPALHLYQRLGFTIMAENGAALEMRWTG